MEIQLKNLLKGCLIIPYQDDVIEGLESACHLYAQENNTHDDVADLTISMVYNDWDDDFQAAIEKAYADNTEREITLPKCTLRAFAAYCIVLMLNDKERSIENCLAFMNSIVVANGNYSQIPYPEFFTMYLDAFDKYYLDNMLNSDEDFKDVESVLFRTDENEKLQDFSATELVGKENTLRIMAKESWLFRIGMFAKGDIMKECSNPYEKALCFVSFIATNMPWVFANVPIEDLLAWSCIPKDCEHESLSSIKTMVADCEIPVWNSNSSIILRVLDDDIDYPALLNSHMGVWEFAIHLYYELMLEKIFA